MCNLLGQCLIQPPFASIPDRHRELIRHLNSDAATTEQEQKAVELRCVTEADQFQCTGPQYCQVDSLHNLFPTMNIRMVWLFCCGFGEKWRCFVYALGVGIVAGPLECLTHGEEKRLLLRAAFKMGKAGIRLRIRNQPGGECRSARGPLLILLAINRNGAGRML